MAAYRREVDAIAGHFKGYQVEHIDRRKNEVADTLSRLGSQHKPVPPNTFLDILHNPSVKVPTKDTTKKYTSVMIRVCHSRSRFLSCMYIHDKFMTESR